MNHKNEIARTTLEENLLKLNQQQLKFFYGILVHAWASQKAFISTQNFYNLWCEFNCYCFEADEGFPDPYDDHELLKSFCHAHPYYFIDILRPELVINLISRYLDNQIDLLVMLADKLRTEGLRAAFAHSVEVLGLSDNVDELVAQAEEHVKIFS